MELVIGTTRQTWPLNGARRGAPVTLLVSAAVHAVALAVLAGTVVHTFAPPAPIRVTIREQQAPPPPPPDGAPVHTQEVTTAPRAVAPPNRPRAKPRPRPETPLASADANAAPRAESPEGVSAGVAGGVPGGQLGGTVGGSGDRVWPADQVASPPRLLSGPKPHYPPAARARGIEGLVVLQTIVDRDGRLEDGALRVAQSIPGLDDAAIAAVRQWRFQPGRDSVGEPVRVVLRVPIRFQLR